MMKVSERAKRIKMLLLDVDGVMTDGTIIMGPKEGEMKRFNIRDGVGIALARAAGLRVGILSGRHSAAVRRRARELRIDEVRQGHFFKERGYQMIRTKYGLRDEEVAFLGDDIIDLPVLKRVGLAISVANGIPEVKKISHYVTKERGGEGAVREVVEMILSAMGKKEAAVNTLLRYGKRGKK